MWKTALQEIKIVLYLLYHDAVIFPDVLEEIQNGMYQLFSFNLQNEINYAPIINRINYISEKVLCSKNGIIVTEIYLKSLGTKKYKKYI